ncbi:hypothetical protein C2S51_010129 [Perilla frutescens var. frutescens]|nr:hypothetical protein C2S51_010129 [Perilla frutescens var. frutescens]
MAKIIRITTVGNQSHLSSDVADDILFKELQENKEKMYQRWQGEIMKRDAAEMKLQEQLTELYTGMRTNFEDLRNTLAIMQLQLMNINKCKQIADDDSILGDPPPGIGFASQVTNPFPNIEIPKFNRSNPRAWILRCSEYFKLMNNIPDNEKITLASKNFEGKAALWYHNFSSKNLLVDWKQFVEVISARFEDLKEARVFAEFNKLKHIGSYADYVDKFKELRSYMLLTHRDLLTEEYFMASFVSGLSEDLQATIRMFNPTILQQTIELGQDQIQFIEALTRKVKGSTKPAPTFIANLLRADIGKSTTRDTPPKPTTNPRRHPLSTHESQPDEVTSETALEEVQITLREITGEQCLPTMKLFEVVGKSCTPIELAYDKITFTITVARQRIEIQAMSGEERCQFISTHAPFGMVHCFTSHIEETFWVKIKDDYEETNSQLDKLLQNFEKVFKETIGLLTGRRTEHSTTLKQGSLPKHQYPYMVTYAQKNENGNKVVNALSSKEVEEAWCEVVTTVTPTWIQQVANNDAIDTFHYQIIEVNSLDLTTFPDLEKYGEMLRYKGRVSVGTSNCSNATPISEHVWFHVSMETSEDFPKSYRNDVIPVVVDKYSKSGHFMTPSHSCTTSTVTLEKFRQQTRLRLKENLRNAQDIMKFHADLNKREWESQIGNQVSLKLLPFCHNTASLKNKWKPFAQYYGSYTVLPRIRKMAYHLEFPASSQVHLVFHASLLKNVTISIVIPTSEPSVEGAYGIHVVEPSQNMDGRVIFQRRNLTNKFLVRWGKFNSFGDSWKNEKLLIGKFQNVNPWGQEFHGFKQRRVLCEEEFVQKIDEEVIPFQELPELGSEGVFQLASTSVLDTRIIQRGCEMVTQFLVKWKGEKLDLDSCKDQKSMKNKFLTVDSRGRESEKGGSNVVNLAFINEEELFHGGIGEAVVVKEEAKLKIPFLGCWCNQLRTDEKEIERKFPSRVHS